jgi:hypothetical protein
MSKAAEIAELLHTDEGTARRFTEHVQQLVVSPLPSFKVIAEAIRNCLDRTPSADQVAEELRKRGFPKLAVRYGFPKPAARQSVPKPAAMQSFPKPKARRTRSQDYVTSPRPRPPGMPRPDGASRVSEPLDVYTGHDYLISPPVPHHDPTRDPREATEGLQKCPHGIPMARPCAICKRGILSDQD